jgi:eukaryotic-like serine/threonine-protein kinase
VSLENYGRYQLLKKLATGGMAQIYLARQLGVQGIEKLLVVKRILPHLAENDDFITMFLDEARIAARLNHPNVVQIFDLGQQDDTFYIAMEYIHGEDIRKVSRQAKRLNKPIPIPLICRIVVEACAGLDYAHKKVDPAGRPLNIVHRDISPQNVLVSFEGGVKVVDFGIAKAADQATVTKSGVLKGKYSYMSPEQAQGQPVDARSDVFALGVVMYELLTGTRVFKRANDIQTLSAVMEYQAPPPSAIDERLPKELDPIVMRALEKDREARYQGAREMQEALEDWLRKNEVPSGSVHLGAFMQDLYADRLAREVSEGKLHLTDSQGDQSQSDELDKVTPHQSVNSRRTVPSSKQRARSETNEVTRGRVEHAAPSPVDVSPWPTENSMPTQQSSPSRVPQIAWGLVLGMVLVLGGYLAFRPTRSSVTVTSTPSGALVTVDGEAIDCLTPCSLPALPEGEHVVQLTKRGFSQGTTRVTVPSSGEANIGVVLRPEAASLAPVEMVEVTITTEPLGAIVTLDGSKRGLTPLTLKLPAGSKPTVMLELLGYEGLSERVELPNEKTALTKAFTLKPSGAAVRKEPGVRREPDVRPVVSGTVRFAVAGGTYATVECPPYSFGTTPFGDKQMPAGDYKCTFTNSDLGKTVTKNVHVIPGEIQKVKVTFE